MYSSQYNFFDYFNRDMLIATAKKDQDYVMLDGVLKKGQWKTMPNGIHIFIVDGKIEAGPESTIGKSPEELDWDEVHDKEKDKIPQEVRPEVNRKYYEHFVRAAGIKNKQSRYSEIDKIWTKMEQEDTFHCIFLNSNGKTNDVLDDLTKVFSDYGTFPIRGSLNDQMIFYKDRVALLKELSSALPKENKEDIKFQIEDISRRIETMKNLGKAPDLNKNDPAFKDPANQPKPNDDGETTKIKTVFPTHQTKKDDTIVLPKQKNVTPKHPKVSVPSKNTRAKKKEHVTIESLLRNVFKSIVRFIALSLFKTTKKSNAFENKILHKVTKQILSNTSIYERDNFYDVLLKTFKKKT